MSLSSHSKRGSTHGRCEQRTDETGTWWWVTELDCGDMGPYRTRAEAESDRLGVERFYRKEWKQVERKLPAVDDVEWEPGQRRLFE